VRPTLLPLLTLDSANARKQQQALSLDSQVCNNSGNMADRGEEPTRETAEADLSRYVYSFPAVSLLLTR
jgi:hypothetical protein